MSLSIKDERIDLRVPADLKKLIEQAAVLTGQSVTTFLLGASIRHAHEVIRNSEIIELTNEERDILLAALDDTSLKPNAALLRSVERYKALIG
jgi:uncharacterized protein (DUF1778 family)